MKVNRGRENIRIVSDRSGAMGAGLEREALDLMENINHLNGRNKAGFRLLFAPLG